MKAISLFSGMGGDTLGIKDAGVDVVAFSEYNKDAIESHLANFPDSELIGNGDITKTTNEELSKYSNVDLIFAGFPCQGFSNAGKKLPDDPRNTLFKEFSRSASVIKPKIIIGENVKGLLSRKNYSGEMYIDVIKREFNALGYHIRYGLVKCEEHGVPQKRVRLFIVGVLDDRASNHWTQHLNLTTNNPLSISMVKGKPYIDLPKEPEVGMRDFLEPTLENSTEFDLDCVPEGGVIESNDDPSGDPHPYLLLKMGKVETHYWNPSASKYEYNGKSFDNLFSFSKRDSPIHCEIVDVDKPAKTIICTYGHQPRMFVPLKKGSQGYVRAFTVNELKQIQSFPADFIVKGSISSQIAQIGNAVPPKACTKLVKEIIKNV
jgi:DNA (cytosine-5)-methyltransferase 1